MSQYHKMLEDFRHHYYTKHGIKLDDEVLYFFIRVNEMQVDLKKDIKAIPEIRFRNGWDYFLYGLGRITWPSIIFLVFLIVVFIFLCFLFHK